VPRLGISGAVPPAPYVHGVMPNEAQGHCVCANYDVEHVASPALDVAGYVNEDNTVVREKA